MGRRWAALPLGICLLGLLWWAWPGDPPPTARDRLPSPIRSPEARVEIAPAPLSAPATVPEPAPSPAPAPQELEDKLVTQLVTEADQAFERADLESATRMFQDIVERYPDSTMAPYAAYKLAWCKFNEGDRMDAIRSMELLLHWLETSPVPQAEVLAESAHKDLELFRTTDD